MAGGTPDHLQEWQRDFIRLAYPLFPTKKISEIIGRKEGAIVDWASRKKIKKAPIISPGDIFGRLTVLDKFEITMPKYRKKWYCHCKCGEYVWVLQDSLIGKRTFSCGCLFVDLKKVNDTKHIPRWFYKRMHRGATRRNMPVQITIEDLEEIFVNQNFKCPLTNLELRIAWGTRDDSIVKSNASVDRKDSTKGYTKDNIHIIHVDANFMKGMYSEQHFINICHLIAKNTIYIEDYDLLHNFKKECKIGQPEWYNKNMVYNEDLQDNVKVDLDNENNIKLGQILNEKY